MSINGIGRPKIEDDPTLPPGLSKTFRQRFWAKVKKTDSCWLWQSKAIVSGYGYIGKGHRDGCVLSHRASWMIHFGEIPEGKYVLHDCPGGDNKLCVNPDHLWLGTHADNMEDGIAKGTATQGERNPMAKLTYEKVDQIRAKYKAGGISIRRLAREYKVCWQTISMIIHLKIWNRNKVEKID